MVQPIAFLLNKQCTKSPWEAESLRSYLDTYAFASLSSNSVVGMQILKLGDILWLCNTLWERCAH